LLIEPASTISTISMVAASVMRRPAANSMNAEPLQHGRDLRSAAMHHHRIDGGHAQENDVAREGFRQVFVAHGMAAILMTMVSSSYRCMCGSASDRMRA